MTLTTLDPTTALVVIDLQKGIVSLPMAHPTAAVVENATRLLAAFRQHRRPVVLVNVAGGAPGRTEQRNTATRAADWAELVPELGAQAGDLRITKHTWGAFTNTDLETQLRAAGVTQIVLAGIATSIGVESTAREAHARGFNVTLATDAMTDFNAEAHANSVTRIFPRLGETGTTADVVAELERRGT